MSLSLTHGILLQWGFNILGENWEFVEAQDVVRDVFPTLREINVETILQSGSSSTLWRTQDLRILANNWFVKRAFFVFLRERIGSKIGRWTFKRLCAGERSNFVIEIDAYSPIASGGIVTFWGKAGLLGFYLAQMRKEFHLGTRFLVRTQRKCIFRPELLVLPCKTFGRLGDFGRQFVIGTVRRDRVELWRIFQAVLWSAVILLVQTRVCGTDDVLAETCLVIQIISMRMFFKLLWFT